MKDKKAKGPINETLRKIFETVSGAPVAPGEKEPECTITNEDVAPKANRGVSAFFEGILSAVLIVGSIVVPALMIVGICLDTGTLVFHYMVNAHGAFFATLRYSAGLMVLTLYSVCIICFLSVAVAIVVFLCKTFQQFCTFVYYKVDVYLAKRKLDKNYREITGKLRTLDKQDAEKTEATKDVVTPFKADTGPASSTPVMPKDPTVVNSAKAKTILYSKKKPTPSSPELIPPVDTHIVKSSDVHQ